MNLSVNIAGVEWKNPVTVASGTFGSGAEYAEFVDRKGLQTFPGRAIPHRVWQKYMAV